jgi:hypothetical protein
VSGFAIWKISEKLNEVEREAREKRFALETDRSRHTAALTAAADETDRRKIETANLADARLAFIKELPTALGSLAVQELNLGDNMLARLADAARDVLGKEAKKWGLMLTTNHAPGWSGAT